MGHHSDRVSQIFSVNIADNAACRDGFHLLSELVPRRALLRNSRKTECGAKQFLTPTVVRTAPFALLMAPWICSLFIEGQGHFSRLPGDFQTS
jgi:hypothetical protein